MNYPIWRILIIMLFLVWPYAKLSAALPILNVPVRVYIISDMQMSKQGQDLSSWISESDFSREVLPEVNRIWKPARIVFSLESVQKAPALDHKNKAKII